MLTKSDTQNNNPFKLTIFKPPAFIYKLTKYHLKNTQNLNYEIYNNKQFSLRKYTNIKLNLSNPSQISFYQWRKNHISPIVKVVYVQLLQQNLSNSAVQKNNNSTIAVNIYVEHIQKILADMINLTLNQSIYVLKQCLLAFQSLFEKFSAVSINKFQIGLNAQGKLKVWINQNFALNHPYQRQNQCQTSHNQILIQQTAIVNKVIHILCLLSHSNCKFFYFGLEKQLTLKKFTFNNCLQYINNFVTNTNNFQIPQNLSYMLPKKASVYLQKSNVRFGFNNPIKHQKEHNRNRKMSENLSFINFNTFKNIGSIVRQKNRQKTDFTPKSRDNQTKNTKIYSKRYSQNIPINIFSVTSQNTKNEKNQNDQFQNQKSRRNQTKVSLQVIIQKTRKNSLKSNEIDKSRKSNVSLNRQRPSISIIPSFINKSTSNKIPYKPKQNQNQIRLSFNESQNRGKSNSLQSSKSRDYYSLINSKMTSSKNASQVVQHWKTRQDLCKTDTNKYKNCREMQRSELIYSNKNNQSNNTKPVFLYTPTNANRSRSASANINFGSYKFDMKASNTLNNQVSSPQIAIRNFQRRNSKNMEESLQKKDASSKRSSQRNNHHTDKASDRQISNDLSNSKNKSFLTKTNYDSVTEDNERVSSTHRMNFSSMSIQYRMANKTCDLFEMSNTQKYDVKRSLMSFKGGFQKILENPSCKQVEQQNQSKSYDGSSLKNTQNIQQVIQKNIFHQNLRRNSRKQDQNSLSYSNSNNYSFGNASSKGIAKKIGLKDSIDQNWDLIKQKNDELLIKNQWKKTINNLESLQNMDLNQSIVDVCGDSIIEYETTKYSQVRLQKLDRLGKNMVYSIVKKDPVF